MTRPLVRPDCPDWCVAGHGSRSGEESWLHTSEPLPLTDGLGARLAMTSDAQSGQVDGPYLLVGTTEYTLEQATALTETLASLLQRGREWAPAAFPAQSPGRQAAQPSSTA